jgi:predicted nucleic acid-binding protein
LGHACQILKQVQRTVDNCRIVTIAELLSGVAQSTNRTESEARLREVSPRRQILGIDERIART